MMPSDKHNLITAKAMGLMFLLFDVALPLNVLFGTLKYVQYILHGLTFVSHSSLLTNKKGVNFEVGM